MTDLPSQIGPYRNRIIGLRVMPVGELVDNPHNWRQHPDAQRNGLDAVMRQIGVIDVVHYNEPTDRIFDGHLRKKLFSSDPETPVIVLVTDMDEHEEKLALATYDPIGALAESDAGKLVELLGEINDSPLDVGEDLSALLSSVGETWGEDQGGEDVYTAKIEAPLYEVTGECPDVSELFDDSRTKSLVSEIESADFLSDEERRFLLAAAQRHTVLNFERIAEYYAHASADLQRLMENSALVIIDFDRAIELGFVKMSEAIAEMVTEEDVAGWVSLDDGD